MRNLLLTIKFCGSAYCGYQVQKNGITIAEKIQNAIEKLTGVRSDIKGCSRTDSGVHAMMYCISFKTESKIPCNKIVQGMNRFLPHDIAVYDCKEMSHDFHARYSCLGKEYLYCFHNSYNKDPFLHLLAYRYGYNIDVDKIGDAGQILVGTHDFKSFCGANTKIIDTVRTVHSFDAVRQGDMVKVYISGDGFLFNMVRIMIGTMLWVNSGRITKDDLSEILKAKDRSLAGPTAPAHGLYLNRVFYS